VLDYIWTVVKKELKKRIMIVDEAWYLMQYPDSASFLRGIVKRGRKYYLGVTTITQDVDDFLATPYGKEIVTNSSIQILLKQHSAAIDQVGQVFYLSEGEKQLLLSADKGEGIFFAGQNHVAIRVIASPSEHKLITSNPEEVMRMKQQAAALKLNQIPTIKPVVTNENKIEDTKSKDETVKSYELSTVNKDESIKLKTENLKTDEQTKTEVMPAPQTIAPVVPITNAAPVIESKSAIEASPSRLPDQPVIVTERALMDKTTPTGSTGSPLISAPTGSTGSPLISAPTASLSGGQATPTASLSGGQATPTASQSGGQAGRLYQAEVVVEGPKSEIETVLERKIAEMEVEENKKVEEHKAKLADEQKKAEEEKNKAGQFGGGSLPKYQDLFKSFSTGGVGKLPPLPPLPKFEPPKMEKPKVESLNSNLNNNQNKIDKNIFKPEVVAPSTGIKPVFVPKQTEVKVSQPPQLAKKNGPVFESTTPSQSTPTFPSASGQGVGEKKPDETKPEDKKLNYEDLFGNGIV
jgi:hypothetical protein